MPLRGPSCKLRLARFSARLKFQDGPSVAKMDFVIIPPVLLTEWQCPVQGRTDRICNKNNHCDWTANVKQLFVNFDKL